MKFGELAGYLEKLEKTSSRIEITKILAHLFGEAKPNEIDKITYLVLGQLAPSYQGIVFNMADKMVIRALARASKKDNQEITKLFKQKGDLGGVAFDLSAKKETKSSVLDVYEKLTKIAKDEGADSQERKVENLARLLSEVDGLSAKFITRITLGRLRLGFSDKTILDSLSWLVKGDKSVKSELEKAYFVLPDAGLLAKRVKEFGIEKAVKEVKPVVGVPVLPMLAQRLKSPEEMVAKMGVVSAEPKLDGLRLSIHYKKGKFVKAYTRNMNENSWMFPELTKIGEQIKADEVILDSEAVGLDEETKQMANFQATMTRRRKHEIEKTLQKIGIEFFVFDLLLKDGENLMNKKYEERRKELEKVVKPGKVLKLVDYEITKDPARINELFREKIKQGYEGLIVKKADAGYVSGRTGWRWVKMKQEATSAAKLADTIDAVVMGYTLGKGKRAQFGMGQFLVGIRKGEKYLTTTKIGTGLTDEQFREMSKRLEKLRTKEKPKEYEVHKNYTPDYWVTPSLVVEIAADEITVSPTHTAGLALRFPRLVRFRDDKSPAEATTLKELQKLFEIQKA
jgi:DNA ligase-1